VNSTAFSRIPCATEQGIFKCLSGNFFRGTGNLISSRFTVVRCRDRSEQSARDMSALPPIATELLGGSDLPCNLQFAGRFSEIAGRADPIGCQIS
jgi:hypothetical protein